MRKKSVLHPNIKSVIDDLICGYTEEGINHHYAGIGSRETPQAYLEQMTTIATYLAARGWILRSGGASGADMAFEQGADHMKEIFLPWPNFNGSFSHHFVIPEEAFQIASEFHPAWNNLSPTARLLMGRNVQQVRGKLLTTPSKFVICWTPDGADGYNIRTSQNTGGTGQAIRIAHASRIPVYNIYKELEGL